MGVHDPVTTLTESYDWQEESPELTIFADSFCIAPVPDIKQSGRFETPMTWLTIAC